MDKILFIFYNYLTMSGVNFPAGGGSDPLRSRQSLLGTTPNTTSQKQEADKPSTASIGTHDELTLSSDAQDIVAAHRLERMTPRQAAEQFLLNPPTLGTLNQLDAAVKTKIARELIDLLRNQIPLRTTLMNVLNGTASEQWILTRITGISTELGIIASRLIESV